MGQQEKQRSLFFMRTLGVGLWLLLMSWLLRLVGKFTKTSYSNTDSQRSQKGALPGSYSTPNLQTIRKSGLSPQIPQTPGWSGRDWTGSSSMRPPYSLKTSGNNILDQPFQIEGDGHCWLVLHEDTIGYMICTSGGSLLIIPNGNHGSTPLPVQGTSAIT